MGVLTVRLSPELREQWRERCEKSGASVSGAVRQIIEQELVKPAIHKTKRSDKQPSKRRVTVWLTDSEIEAIRVRTRMHGGSRAGWIVRAIRGALTRDPQVGDAEIDVLRASNYELNSIGVNLNQIARRLNEGQTKQEVKPEQIEALSQAIDRHTKAVQAVLDANINRWPLS